MYSLFRIGLVCNGKILSWYGIYIFPTMQVGLVVCHQLFQNVKKKVLSLSYRVLSRCYGHMIFLDTLISNGAAYVFQKPLQEPVATVGGGGRQSPPLM